MPKANSPSTRGFQWGLGGHVHSGQSEDKRGVDQLQGEIGESHNISSHFSLSRTQSLFKCKGGEVGRGIVPR